MQDYLYADFNWNWKHVMLMVPTDIKEKYIYQNSILKNYVYTRTCIHVLCNEWLKEHGKSGKH